MVLQVLQEKNKQIRERNSGKNQDGDRNLNKITNAIGDKLILIHAV